MSKEVGEMVRSRDVVQAEGSARTEGARRATGVRADGAAAGAGNGDQGDDEMLLAGVFVLARSLALVVGLGVALGSLGLVVQRTLALAEVNADLHDRFTRLSAVVQENLVHDVSDTELLDRSLYSSK